MSNIQTGDCSCGTIAYLLRKHGNSPVYACHCTDCQTRTESAFSEHMLVRVAELGIEGATAQTRLT